LVEQRAVNSRVTGSSPVSGVGEIMGGQHAAGKGDQYRPVNWEQYSKNWDDIFKKKKKSKKKVDTKKK
jgi:hypothetical protein